MSQMKVEFVFWLFGIGLFGVVALFPHAFIRALGRGRVKPAPLTMTVFRVLALMCVIALLYRLFWLRSQIH
jgi:hypothetical protein